MMTPQRRPWARQTSALIFHRRDADERRHYQAMNVAKTACRRQKGEGYHLLVTLSRNRWVQHQLAPAAIVGRLHVVQHLLQARVSIVTPGTGVSGGSGGSEACRSCVIAIAPWWHVGTCIGGIMADQV
jgi:hypothetical protein